MKRLGSQTCGEGAAIRMLSARRAIWEGKRALREALKYLEHILERCGA